MIIYSNATDLNSNYIPFLNLTHQVKTFGLEDGFIMDKIKSFFDKSNLNIIDFEALPVEKSFTEVEFLKRIPDESELSFINQYLYKTLANDMRRNVDGKITYKPKYVATLDKRLAPMKIDQFTRYGELRLGKFVLLYFIYIDLQELLRHIKGYGEEKKSRSSKSSEG